MYFRKDSGLAHNHSPLSPFIERKRENNQMKQTKLLGKVVLQEAMWNTGFVCKSVDKTPNFQTKVSGEDTLDRVRLFTVFAHLISTTHSIPKVVWRLVINDNDRNNHTHPEIHESRLCFTSAIKKYRQVIQVCAV